MVEFHHGRKPPVDKPKLAASNFLPKATIPYPPYADILSIGGWQMLGNDRYGTCVPRTWANERREMTRLVNREQYPGWDQVAAAYKTQNPGFPNQDEGMVIQYFLEYLNTIGGPDGVKCVAFAQVDISNLDEVKAALSLFGHLWIGITVKSANMTQFNRNQPWDYVPTSPNEGGHSVIGGGYDTDLIGGDVKFETWTEVTSFTDEFWAHQVDEAWVVIWPEHLENKFFTEHVDMQGLKDGYRELTGRDLPIPDPTVDPADRPDGADLAFASAFKTWSPSVFSRVTKAGKLKVAGQAWLRARGIS
jgi:hypothetical protein